MAALVDEHFNVEVENGVKFGGCVELGVEEGGENCGIEDSVRALLQCLGEDINREGLRKTPFRVAKALREGTRGYKQKVNDIIDGALFPEAGLESGIGQAGGAGGIVIVRDLDLFSYCESCLLPFQVKCHVGYVPAGQRVVGLSKLSRVADIFAKRLQDPQRLADEVCAALQQGIEPRGVALVLQCWHLNVESAFLDTNRQGWVKSLVASGSGVFEDEKADIWSDFISLLKFRGIDMGSRTDQSWCPSQLSCHVPNSTMTNAVVSILRSLGEDPSRKELIGTPSRFVKWFMNFKNSNSEMKPNGFVRARIDPLGSNGEVGPEELSSEVNLPFWS
ncbi:PREDICTED: GTP cyclohydrolase 1-like [Ipomoea nil]|uniref:GTP cyclohydrolase 1-like n=1 Tax=Ipomoea nil TaxID=35883 RepID=UPI0009018C7E|nr:PREDICTED: GTP cyclohydrolase 1-like [Ipomoea nil]